MADRLKDMLDSCNVPNIYEKDYAVQAYSLLHFLERYRRYQLVYITLIDRELLPFSDIIKHLDVGTGPAPSIFALSDIIKFYKEFSQERGAAETICIDYIPDYVENSDSFRKWLHDFTEFFSYKNYSGSWNIPYHYGSFSNFESLDFIKLNYNKELWQRERIYEAFGSNPNYTMVDSTNEISVYGQNYMGGLIYDKRKNAHRYDVISFSYFLTQMDKVKSWKKQVKGCAFALKNNGIILNIGANNDEYFKISRYLRRTIQRYRTIKNNHLITCREVFNETISYNTHDLFSKRIKQSYGFMLDNLNSLSDDNSIAKSVKIKIEKFINSNQNNTFKDFRLQVFQKRIILPAGSSVPLEPNQG